MDAVQRDLNLLLTQDQIDNGGLSIYTTLDPTVQNAAQDALETQLHKNRAPVEFSIIRSRLATKRRRTEKGIRPCRIWKAGGCD